MNGAPITRRGFLTTSAAFVAAARVPWQTAPARPVPTPSQLEWQRDQLAVFIHFGVNTFTDREWGDGTESPSIFAPAALDARQWARAARAGGFRAMILTAKHHDGFCLWPTRTTDHSVKSSPFRAGGGDVVREFVNACKAEGLKAGLYLSPWDRHEKSYGDSPRYNDLYCDQLTELLTNYGPLNEVWFDGANGEGPNGKKQEYDWARTWSLVRKLQPKAVMFSDAGPDVRWIGNETGQAADTNWSMVDPAVVPVPGLSGANVMRMLQHGDPTGTAWRPGETDVSIRPGWFHHPAENARVKSADRLVQLFFSSVGRNSKLLLNVPPNREGVLDHADVASLKGMKSKLEAMFDDDFTKHRKWSWQSTNHAAVGEMDFGFDHPVSIVDLRENIEHGQVIAKYLLEGSDGKSWQPLARGTTIGHRKLDRFEPKKIRKIRLVVEEALSRPEVVWIGAYGQ